MHLQYTVHSTIDKNKATWSQPVTFVECHTPPLFPVFTVTVQWRQTKYKTHTNNQAPLHFKYTEISNISSHSQSQNHSKPLSVSLWLSFLSCSCTCRVREFPCVCTGCKNTFITSCSPWLAASSLISRPSANVFTCARMSGDCAWGSLAWRHFVYTKSCFMYVMHGSIMAVMHVIANQQAKH